MKVNLRTYEALKTLTITHVAPTESLIAPVNVPTAEPAAPQFQYTILSADCPTFSFPIYSYIKILLLYFAGQNTTGGSLTLNWRMVRWSGGAWVSISTGSSSVLALNYWTCNAFFRTGADGSTVGVQVGDLFGISVWGGVIAGDFNYDYTASFIFWSRPILFNYSAVLSVNTLQTSYTGNLLLGSPQVYGVTWGFRWNYYVDGDSTNQKTSFPTSKPYYYQIPTSYITIQWADVYSSNGNDLRIHATKRPYYQAQILTATWLIQLIRKSEML